MTLDEQIAQAEKTIEQIKAALADLKLQRIRHIYNIGVGTKFISKGFGWSYAKDKECEVIAIFPEQEIIEVKLVGRADRFRMCNLDLQRQFL